jgi:hypothetical protein
MKKIVMQHVKRAAACLLALATLSQPLLAPGAEAYVLNRNIKGTSPSTCPLPQHWAATTPGIVDRRWNTVMPATTTVFTDLVAVPETATQQIDRAIRNSFDVWASAGTSLTQSSFGPLNQVAGAQCSISDGLNSICFNQSSSFFTGGVLAFTIANSWDEVGVQAVPNHPLTSFIAEIVDADVYFRTDGQFTFATREALAAHPNSFDLETVLTHELGHFFGFSHSAVMRAMMYPFASRGVIAGGVRCAPGTVCDLPLADDDRAGLRVLYPNAADPNVGTISGYILPANLLTLAGLPSPSPGRSVTGIFGAHVVAVDAATGAVVAGTLGGWSCDPNNLPSQFDGFYKIEGLPVGRSYKIFVEPLDSPTDSGDISNAINSLCSQVSINDVCTPPAVHTGFTTKIKPQ